MDQQLTLEYIFFHPEPYREFKQFLRRKRIDVLAESIDQSNVEGLVLRIPDNFDDDLMNEVEAYYDQMLQLNEALVANAESADELHIGGLAVTLADGQTVVAAVQPDVLSRVLSVISRQELGAFVDAIADAVENPDDQPLCKL